MILTSPPAPIRYTTCLILSSLSAGLMMIGFSGVPYVMFVALSPLFVILLSSSFKKSWVSMSIMVVLFYTFMLRWMGTQFHPLAIPLLLVSLLILHTLLLIGIRCLFWVFTTTQQKNHNHFLVLPLSYTLFEHLRTIGFIKFPYGIVAYSQSSFLPFIQFADITGYLGVSFVVYLINALLAAFWLQQPSLRHVIQTITSPSRLLRSPLLFSAGVIMILILLYGFIREGTVAATFESKLHEHTTNNQTNQANHAKEQSAAAPSTSTSVTTSISPSHRQQHRPPIKIALIQPWYDYNKPFTTNNKQLLLDKLQRLTDRSLHHNPDLVVWPESAIMTYYKYRLQHGMNWMTQQYYYYFKSKNHIPNLYFLAGSLGIEEKQTLPSVSNAATNKHPPTNRNRNRTLTAKDYKTKGLGINPQKYYYNIAFLIGNDGAVKNEYAKTYLVPIVEWCPYTNYLPFLKKILEAAQASAFTPGDQLTLFKHPKATFFVLICYEDCFSQLARKACLNGAEILIVITNDAWSYTRLAALQHYQFSILRAIENRRSFLRGSNAGVTCLIDPSGRSHYRLPLYQEAVSTQDIPPETNLSLYTQLGDGPVLISLLLVFLFFGTKKIYEITKKMPRTSIEKKSITD